MSETTSIEKLAQDEYRGGVSPGAAAREICRMLGATGTAPTLRRLLEDMLADANRASTDRARILQDFADAAPDEAKEAKMASFRRMNRLEAHTKQ